MRWLKLRCNFDSTDAFDGRSTAYQRSLRSQWAASRRHADLFIYWGRSAAARSWRSAVAVDSKSTRSCKHRLSCINIQQM